MAENKLYCHYEFALGKRITKIQAWSNGQLTIIDSPLAEHLAMILIELDSRIDDGKIMTSAEAIIRTSALEGLKQLGYDRVYINDRECEL